MKQRPRLISTLPRFATQKCSIKHAMSHGPEQIPLQSQANQMKLKEDVLILTKMHDYGSFLSKTSTH